MTTAAFDGRFMAADTQGDNNGLFMPTKKIYRAEGFTFAGAGRSDQLVRFYRKIKEMNFAEILAHGHPDYDDEDHVFGAIIVPKGNPKLAHYMAGSVWLRIERDFHAIGSGRDFAIAAMACGKTALQAVEIACQFDTNTGGEVDWVDVC